MRLELEVDRWRWSLCWAHSVHRTAETREAGERHAAWGRTTNKFCQIAKNRVKFHDFSKTLCELTRLHDISQAWKTALHISRFSKFSTAVGNLDSTASGTQLSGPAPPPAPQSLTRDVDPRRPSGVEPPSATLARQHQYQQTD